MTNDFPWVFEIPLNDVRTSGVHNTDTDVCLLCGKVLKAWQWSVHLLTNGNLVSSADEFAENEDQGFFPIGAECKKRLPNNFYWRNHETN